MVSRDDDSDCGFCRDNNVMVNFQELEMSEGQVCCGCCVGVQCEVLKVSVLAGSVSSVTNGF